MIDNLANILLDFPGEPNHIQCLAHIINLVVKINLRQFDVCKKKEKRNLNIPNVESQATNYPMNGKDNVTVLRDPHDDEDHLVRELYKEEKEMRPMRRMRQTTKTMKRS